MKRGGLEQEATTVTLGLWQSSRRCRFNWCASWMRVGGGVGGVAGGGSLGSVGGVFFFSFFWC